MINFRFPGRTQQTSNFHTRKTSRSESSSTLSPTRPLMILMIRWSTTPATLFTTSAASLRRTGTLFSRTSRGSSSTPKTRWLSWPQWWSWSRQQWWRCCPGSEGNVAWGCGAHHKDHKETAHCWNTLQELDACTDEDYPLKGTVGPQIGDFQSFLKEPHYIRCIKPNDAKSPVLFDQKLVEHQVESWRW